ncbi:DUF885 domain-containing protein [Streptosporangium sp. NBC_01755]|uniref:hypothetical protein n=1 Tax=unclassified Streptosporangium TaxID=2632669 RepID=UPI002DDB8732|nr:MULTISPECIES: hypothetical protein [unclassified Streptosporangium]WSA23088.1 DUF885 domain-containing protein [Streptosporangium sp. NBC_01810]WSC98769.1 DUF885 domain-containing protein [Streptosporangium sp. NBC_01755]
MTSPALVSEFIDWYLAENPIYAALAGAPGYDRTLGDFTEAGILARERQARRWLERLQGEQGGQGTEGPGDFEDEIDRIRDDYLAAGRGDLRTFHDTLAGSGGLPLGLARRVALEG